MPPTAIRGDGRAWRSSTSPGSGRFSIDRLVREYAQSVWEAEPVRAERTQEAAA